MIRLHKDDRISSELGLVQKSTSINAVVKPGRTLPRYLYMLVDREKAIELVLKVVH